MVVITVSDVFAAGRGGMDEYLCFEAIELVED